MKPVKIESYSQLFLWRKELQFLGQSVKIVHIGLQIFQHDTCRRPAQLARSVLTGIKSLRSDQSAMEIRPISNHGQDFSKERRCRERRKPGLSFGWDGVVCSFQSCPRPCNVLILTLFDINISNILIVRSFQLYRLFLGLTLFDFTMNHLCEKTRRTGKAKSPHPPSQDIHHSAENHNPPERLKEFCKSWKT